MSEALIIPAKTYGVDTMEWSCRDREERLYPECEWDTSNWMFQRATSSVHPYLQKLIEYKATLTNWMGEWTVMALHTYVMLHVYDGFVNIECISTPVEERRKGSASKVMEALVEAAKETGTELRLRACNMTGGRNPFMRVEHMAIATGRKPKDKIPANKLPKWYAKFGFVKVGDVRYHGKNHGVNMQFIPQSK